MKKIAIFEKIGDNNADEHFENFKKLLGDGFTCVKWSEGEPFDGYDLFVVFGGDGTVLKIAPYATVSETPILAINAGTVGYLSGYELKDIDKCAMQIKENDLVISERSVLEIAAKGKKYLALNDAVVERNRSVNGKAVVSKLSFMLDGKKVYDLSSDGIIISTPTGSTAYSLSAGGVVLAPRLKSFIATPICSHGLGARPVVYDDSSVCEIIVSKSSCDCVLSVDGRCETMLEKGDSVIIKKYGKFLKIVDNDYNFYDKIYRKLG